MAYKVGEVVTDTESNKSYIYKGTDEATGEALLAPMSEPSSYATARASQGVAKLKELAEATYDAIVNAPEKAADWYVDDLRPNIRERKAAIQEEEGEDSFATTRAIAGFAGDVVANTATSLVSNAATVGQGVQQIGFTAAQQAILPLLVGGTSGTYVKYKVKDLRDSGVNITDEVDDSFANAIKARDLELLDKDTPPELFTLAQQVVEARKVYDAMGTDIAASRSQEKKIDDAMFNFTGAVKTGPVDDIGNILTIATATGVPTMLRGAVKAAQVGKGSLNKLTPSTSTVEAPIDTTKVIVAPDPMKIIRGNGPLELDVPNKNAPIMDTDVQVNKSSIYIETDPSVFKVKADTVREALESKKLTLDDVTSTDRLDDGTFEIKTKGKVYVARGYDNLGKATKDLDLAVGDVSNVKYLNDGELSEQVTKIGNKPVVQFDAPINAPTAYVKPEAKGNIPAPDPYAPLGGPTPLEKLSPKAYRDAPEVSDKVMKELDDSMVSSANLPEDMQKSFAAMAMGVAGNESLFAGGVATNGDASALQGRMLVPLGSALGMYAVKGGLQGASAMYDGGFTLVDKIPTPAKKAWSANSMENQANYITPTFKQIFKEDPETGMMNFRNTARGAKANIRTNEVEQFNTIEMLARQQVKRLGANYGSKDIMEGSPHWRAKWARENNKSTAFNWFHGDESGMGGAYIDKTTGLTEQVEGIKAYTTIYKDAVANGAAPEDVSIFQTSRDAVDNYTNLHADMADSIRTAGELTEGIAIAPKKWNKLFDSLYDKQNSLIYIPYKQGDRLENARAKAIADADSILADIPNNTLRDRVEEELTRAIDRATSRSSIDYAEALDNVNKYTKSTPWANDISTELTKFHTHILDQYVDSGMISKATSDTWKKRHPNYLPNYKALRVRGADYDMSTNVDVPRKLRSLSERKVSPKENIDPVIAEYMYTVNAGYHISEAVVRKSILDSTLNLSRQEFNKWFSFADKDKIVKAIQDIEQGKGKDHYSAEELLQDGITDTNLVNMTRGQHIHIGGSTIEVPWKMSHMNDLIRDARTQDLDLDAFQFKAARMIGVHQAKNLTRRVITRNPAFAAATMTKEIMDHMVYSQLPYLKRFEILKAFSDTVTASTINKPAWREFNKLNAGIYHGNIYNAKDLTTKGHKEIAQKFISDTLGDNRSIKQKTLGSIVKATDSILSSTDNAPRIRYYNMLMKNGYSKEQALYLAKTHGVSFTQRGLNPNGVVDTLDYWLPFQRVAVNSADRFARRWRYETKKAAEGFVATGFLYWMAEKANVVPSYEELGVAEYMEKKGIPLPFETWDYMQGLIPGGYVMDMNVAKDVTQAAMQGLDQYFDGAIYDMMEQLGGKEIAENLYKDEVTMKKMGGLLATYFQESMMYSPNMDMGIPQLAQTWTTGDNRYGQPLFSAQDEAKVRSSRTTPNDSMALTAIVQLVSEKTGGTVQIAPVDVQMVADTLLPNVADVAFVLLDGATAKMGLTPERPKVNATADFVGKYFGIPKDNTRATAKFYAVYNGLRSDMAIIDKYGEELLEAKKAGRNPNPLVEQQYYDAIDNSADQVESYEVLKKYGKDFAELREQEMDIVWDRDTTMIPAFSNDVEGNTTKRKMIRDIKDRKAMVAKEALAELQGLHQGTAIMDTYGIPFNMVVQPFVDMLPAKRDKGATYDKSLDTRRLDDLPLENNEEGTVVRTEYVPLSNVQNMYVETPVIDTIITTAQENDINPNTALIIAAMESGSGLDADAEAKTSSAKGIFQITRPTWKSMLDKGIGKEYDIDKSTSVLSPVDNIRMGILLMKEDGDKAVLELGRDINLIEQYSLHHLGYTGGVNFIEAKDTAPYTPITDVISTSAYRANPQFKHPTKGRPMTVGEVHSMWVQRANEKYAELSEEYP